METVPLLDELAIVAVVGALVTVILAKLRLPTVAGLLAAGALVGPFGLGLATSVHDIEALAEVGVVLLLFTIGLEFSLARLKDIFRQVALGGLLQVGLTTLAVAGSAVALGQSTARAIVYGFVFALSSTAIVLRALGDRQELEAPHGRFIVGTLVFQDLCVVPMVLVVPLLGAKSGLAAAAGSIGAAMAKAALVVVVTIVVARVLVPRFLDWVDASRSREVFLLAILGLCIGTAYLTALAGLSLALGAFLAGMLVADTEYGHRAMGDLLPLRDAFVSVFFVSLGMLFDVRVVVGEPLVVGTLLFGFLVAKGVLATIAALAMRFPVRAAWLAGVGLAQFGEFGFVLTRQAIANQVFDERAAAPLFAAGVLSMFLTPLFAQAAPHMRAGEKLLAPLEKLLGVRAIDDVESDAHASQTPHVVIVGFGVAGRQSARALAASGTPFTVLDLNAENVRRGRAEHLPVYYGDATSEEALRHARVEQARLVVLLMNDSRASSRIVDTLRRVAPEVPILVRTRYLSERARFLELGASDVVAEEVEGAVEVIARMLRWTTTPRNVVEERLRQVRAETLTSERKQTLPRLRMGAHEPLARLKLESVLVRDGSAVIGRSPVALQLQSRTGALVVGLERDGKLRDPLDPHEPFAPGDVVFVVGSSDALRAVVTLFDGPGDSATDESA
jgi:monovalent cation:H+ antiporter-2, CPA2 family